VIGSAAADAADSLCAAIRSELRRQAEPERAPGMQAYMRSAMPFLGVRVPDVRRITRAAARERAPVDVGDLLATATGLWRTAGYREERYAATELLGLRVARGRPEALPLCAEMIVTGAWWDHVDAVAHLVGAMLAAHPPALEPVIRGWSMDADRWLRRSAIICQLDARTDTDVELLTAVIEPNLPDPDFFICKAIGWALRQYARTNPTWVLDFVATRRAEMSALSYKEAVKHLT
jgi:3-methyladenine DNA glycosylase AlkD